MKLHLDRAVLLKSLGSAQSVVERRNTIPILGNVKLEAKGDHLALTATDMDIELTTAIPAEVVEPGVTTVPAHTFYEIVRKLPDGAMVEISGGDEGKVVIRAGSSRFNLSCLDVADFPLMTEGDFTHRFTLTSRELLTLIDKTRFAISAEETRYYLNGIFLHVFEENGGRILRAVATDGHRLALSSAPVPPGADGMPGIIIPKKTVMELKRVLDASDTPVEVALSASKIRFASAGTVLLSKLIDGTFPDYMRVIPAGNDKVMEMDGIAFSQGVDRVSTISAEKTRGIKLTLEQGRLTLSASSPEHGTASEDIEVNYAADSLDIGFNARYLLEMMDQIEGDTVQFCINDGASPVLVRDSADVGSLYVIMPMRV